MDVNVNARTIRAPLRPWLHGRIILTLMYPVLMQSPQPTKASARSELGEEEGTLLQSSLCKVTGIEMECGESCRNGDDDRLWRKRQIT